MPGYVPVQGQAGASLSDLVRSHSVWIGLNAFFAFLSISIDPLALLAFGVDRALLTSSFNVVRALEVVLLAHLVSVAWPASAALRAARH